MWGASKSLQEMELRLRAVLPCKQQGWAPTRKVQIVGNHRDTYILFPWHLHWSTYDHVKEMDATLKCNKHLEANVLNFRVTVCTAFSLFLLLVGKNKIIWNHEQCAHTHTQAKPDAKSCMHILHTHSGIKRCHNWRKVRSYPYPIKNLLEHSRTFLRPPEELSFRVTMSHFCCPGLWAKTLQGSTTLLVWTCQTFPDTVLHSRSPWRSSTACITPQQRPAIGPSWLLSLYISLDGHSSSPSRRTNLSEKAPFRGCRGPDCPGLTHFQESKQKQNRSFS